MNSVLKMQILIFCFVFWKKEGCKNSRLEEHSARVIAQVAKQSPKFAKPYMNPILTALVPKLSSEMSHVDVTVQVCSHL